MSRLNSTHLVQNYNEFDKIKRLQRKALECEIRVVDRFVAHPMPAFGLQRLCYEFAAAAFDNG
jgi:hypothetical protein